MTAKDAMKCVSLLEKAFGWKVWFYTMHIGGKEEWLYNVKLAGSRFDDDSPRVFFDTDMSCAVPCFTKAAAEELTKAWEPAVSKLYAGSSGSPQFSKEQMDQMMNDPPSRRRSAGRAEPLPGRRTQTGPSTPSLRRNTRGTG